MDQPNSSGELHELTYYGGSMRSLFRDGERLRVRACSMDAVRAGDVIVFRASSEERHVVHRVIRREETVLLTRGDDLVTVDVRPVTYELFVGRVEAVQRRGSWNAVCGGRGGWVRGQLWHSIRSIHLLLLRLTGRYHGSKSSKTIRVALRSMYPILSASEKSSLSSEDLPTDAMLWPAIVALADQHELAPYLCWQLNRANLLDTVPIDSRERLQRHYRQAWVQYQRLFAAQRRISSAFRDRDMDLIVLKGLYFAHSLYPDPATRPMTDLDLLVRESDVTPALEIFQSLGFQRQGGGGSIAESKEIWLYEPQRRIKVDLHVGLLPYYADFDWDVAGVWDRAARVEVDGLSLRVLAPEDQLIHLVLHGGVEHLLQPLKVMLDARLAWNTWGAKVDAQSFNETVTRAGLQRAAGLTFAATEAVFGPLERVADGTEQSVPDVFVRWVSEVGPVIHRPALLRLYAGRDYLLYGRKRLRRLLVQGRSGSTGQAAESGNAETGRGMRYVLRRGLTLLGLAVGVVVTAVSHPERRPFTFLRLVLWVTERR
ncbi:nucleotidyltransferase family protein [bacterium]|nr:nucleotidyltransferase family protein [bacterium]